MVNNGGCSLNPRVQCTNTPVSSHWFNACLFQPSDIFKLLATLNLISRIAFPKRTESYLSLAHVVFWRILFQSNGYDRVRVHVDLVRQDTVVMDSIATSSEPVPLTMVGVIQLLNVTTTQVIFIVKTASYIQVIFVLLWQQFRLRMFRVNVARVTLVTGLGHKVARSIVMEEVVLFHSILVLPIRASPVEHVPSLLMVSSAPARLVMPVILKLLSYYHFEMNIKLSSDTSSY